MRRGCAVATACLVLSCDSLDSDDDNNGPTGNQFSIVVAVSPTSLSVAQGSSGSTTVMLTRGGGFGGAVAFTATGLPSGATASISPQIIGGTATQSTVTVTVDAGVAPGTYTATVTATAAGLTNATTSFQVVITAAPNYSLSATPAAVAIAAGESGTTVVNINRANLPGAITLALANPPAGIFGTFDTSPTTLNTSTLTINVASSVNPATYSLTIQATAGTLVRSLVLPVTVTPAPTGGNNIEYHFCDASSAPVFLAFQNSSGAWQPVLPTTGGGSIEYAFTISQGRGGVLAVFRAPLPMVHRVRSGTRTSVMQQARRLREAARIARATTALPQVDVYFTSVFYGTAAELAQDGVENCLATQPTKSVRATVLGIQGSQYGVISLGGATQVFAGAVSNNPITLEGVLPGPVDLVASRLVPGQAPNKAVVMRNLNVPDGGALPSAVDFDASTIIPVNASVTVSGASGDNLEVYSEVVTATTRALFWNEFVPTLATTRLWAGLPQSAMGAYDYHGLIVFASPTSGSGDFRAALKYVGPVANQTVSLGPAGVVPTSSLVAGGGAYPRLRFQGNIPAEYSKGFGISLLGPGDGGNAYDIVMTNAYLAAAGNAQAFDVTMPDVAALAGFPVASRLTPGTNDLSTDSFGFTGSGIRDLRPSLGAEFRAAIRFTTVAVP